MSNVLERVNNFIIFKIIRLIVDCEAREDEAIQKATYALRVIMDEAEKFLFLLLIFTALGKTKAFIIVMITIGAIRGFLGGSHRKTQLACLLFSFAIIYVTICFAEFYRDLLLMKNIIYIIDGMYIYFKAPVISKMGIKYTYSKKLNFRLKGITILFIISRVVEMVPEQYANLILSALLVQIVEVSFVLIKNKKGDEKNDENT